MTEQEFLDELDLLALHYVCDLVGAARKDRP